MVVIMSAPVWEEGERIYVVRCDGGYFGVVFFVCVCARTDMRGPVPTLIYIRISAL